VGEKQVPCRWLGSIRWLLITMPDQNRESPFPTRVEGFCKRLLCLLFRGDSVIER
jgi:hypothetical protein